MTSAPHSKTGAKLEVVAETLARGVSEDVWVLVARELDKPDLYSLCLCSTGFLHIVRPVLYRNVTLKYIGFRRKDELPVTDPTLQLLLSNPSLANNVKYLTVYLYQTEAPISGLLAAILAMNFLVSLHIDGEPLFGSAEEQRDFVKKFKAKKVALSEIDLWCQYPDPNEPFDINSLTRVGWRSRPSLPTSLNAH